MTWEEREVLTCIIHVRTRASRVAVFIAFLKMIEAPRNIGEIRSGKLESSSVRLCPRVRWKSYIISLCSRSLYQIGIQFQYLAHTKKVVERVLSAKHGPGLLFFVIETWHQNFEASHRG